MSFRTGGALRRGLSTSARPLSFETLEHRQLLAATAIQVHAAGTTGVEIVHLQIDGAPVASWTATRIFNGSARLFDTFTYTHPTDVSIDRIRVAFTNNGLTAGVDRNLWVDGITVNNAKYESEANSVYS